MIMKKLFTLLAFVVTVTAMSQSVAISDDGSVADGSAILEVKSTTKGFLLPRMDKDQRDAIIGAVAGLQIWCTDCVPTGAMYFYTGSKWSNGGTGITSEQAADIITNNAKTSDINHVASSSTTDLIEGSNLYYTETRVSANTDVATNKTNIASETGRVNDQAVLIMSLQAQVNALINEHVVQLPSVTIGGQVWQSRNLDVATYRDGTAIPEVTDKTKWGRLKTGAWCYYDDDPANGETYGKLYNWYAVMGITTAEDDTPTEAQIAARKKFAPTGWHVPSDSEWTTLTNFLGDYAGDKMKEIGTEHWNSPNTDATNSSGFTALPGGYALYDGKSYNIGTEGRWWRFDQKHFDGAWFRFLDQSNRILRGGYFAKVSGCSVRLLRD
jgi:uncharacterized protein (TIGR02145 family)